MNPFVVAVGISAGICWSAGVVGKRAAVGDVSLVKKDNERYIATLALAVIYLLVACIPPCIMVVASAKDVGLVIASPEWRQHVPTVLLLGSCGGIGTMLSIQALDLGARVNMSSATAIIMNAVNTAGQPLVLALAFGGLSSFKLVAWIWMFVTVCGAFLLDPSLETWLTSTDADERRALVGSHEQEQQTISASCLSQSTCAVLLAVMAGLGWDVGGIGDRLAVLNVPEGQKTVWAALGQGLSCLGALIPVLAIIAYYRYQLIQSIVELSDWKRRVVLLAAGCLVQGFGSVLLSVGEAMVDDAASSFVCITTGVYTVTAAALICIIWQEALSTMQLCGAAVVTVGIVSLTQST